MNGVEERVNASGCKDPTAEIAISRADKDARKKRQREEAKKWRENDKRSDRKDCPRSSQ